MSRNLNNPSSHRDYGATSSSSHIPDVNFSGFSPTEFMSLSEDIGQNINAVNSSSRQLEKILKVIGTKREQQSTRNQVHNIHAEANSRIEATSKDLQRLTSVVQRGDKQQKLQLEKLATDFRSIVEKYTSVQLRITAAMRQSLSQSQLAHDQDEQTVAARAELVQQQEQMRADLQMEQELLLDREREIRKIEADVVGLNATMRNVYNTLLSQGEEVDNIEASIENTATNVEMGREELAKAAQHRRSYRRKILILVLIAVIIGLIVTGVIVGKLKS